MNSFPTTCVGFVLAATFTMLESKVPGQEVPPKASGDRGDKIAKLLDAKMDWDYNKEPLGELCKSVGRRLEMNVRINVRALEDSGLSSDLLLSLRARKMRVRHFLSSLLAPHDLTWVLRDNAIEVTTFEWAEGHPQQLTIDVSDLVNQLAFPGSKQSSAEVLLELVHAVAADSWKKNGGIGTASIQSKRLTISQIRDVNDEVQGLITVLRRATQQRARKELPVAIGIDEGSEEVWAALGKQVDLKFDGTLGKFAERLSDAYGINVLVDIQSLEDVGMDAARMFTFRLLGEFGNELQRSLETLELGWTVGDGSLSVMNSEKAMARTEIRCYLVHDLAQNQEVLDALIGKLKSNAGADSWVDSGGTGIVKAVANPPLLVINQTSNEHRRIVNFLRFQRARR